MYTRKWMIRDRLAITLCLSLGLWCALSTSKQTFAQEPPPPGIEKSLPSRAAYSPYVDRHFPERVYWGDTHLHTSQSFDAIAFGCTLGPEDAYRFARGEEVISSTGQHARLSRPLDFLVVSDHAENMGTMGEIKAGNPTLMEDADLRRWHEMLQAGGQQAMDMYYEIVAAVSGKGKPLPPALKSSELTRSVWKKTLRQQNNTTIQAGSQLSSATSGPPTPKGIICIAS